MAAFEHLPYKTRKRWAIVVLVVGLPLYIILAWGITGMFDRPSILLELLVYIVLGILWILPFRGLFKGIGQPDPDAPPEDDPHR